MSNAKKPEPKVSDLPPIEPVIPERKIRAVSEVTSKILGVKTYLLDDGRVVVSATHMSEAFGLAQASAPSTESGEAQVPRFLAARNLNPFISAGLTAKLKSPIEFAPPHGGRSAYGYDSDLITDIALAIVKAAVKGSLYTRQHKMAQAGEAYLAATSKKGSHPALAGEHGMQPQGGVADELSAKIQEEMEGLRRALDEERDTRITASLQHEAEMGQTRALLTEAKTTLIQTQSVLAEQVKGNARMSEKVALLESNIQRLAGDVLPEYLLACVIRTLQQIATLESFGTDKTWNEAHADAMEALRDKIDYDGKFEDMPLGKWERCRVKLRRLVARGLRRAKRRGYSDDGGWQPPLPFMGSLDDDDCDDDGDE